MEKSIDRSGLESHLGEVVEVIEGDEKVRGPGMLAYEHNTGRLSIYTSDGKRIRAFLSGGEVLRFSDDLDHDYRASKDIGRPKM